jgi:hypothetical protein
MSKQQKVEITIPKIYNPEERQAIAIDVIEFIRKRTEDGLDKDGKKFPKYSTQYKKSLDFKIAGKSNSVNLRLTGDMMDLLDVLSTQPGKIKIGYEKGDDINGRVEGNRLGSYGGKPDSSRARDFLGISKKDLGRILDNYPTRDKEERMERVIKVLEVAKESRKIDIDEESE